MPGREKAKLGVELALVALVTAALIVAAPASAKKPTTATVTAQVPLAPGDQQAATASCPAKTHVTGGGWSLTPTFSANSSDVQAAGSGARITHLQSQPGSLRSWTAGAALFNQPATAGTFTTFARCESKTLGRTLLGVSGTSTLPVGQEATIGLNCSKGTHVLSGGFSLSPAGNLADADSFRPEVVESRRRDASSWVIDVVNPAGAPGDATISTNVLCELNAKGLGVSERAQTAPIADNGRTTATASCTGKTHAIGGGFLVSPTVGPAVGVDQMQPVGQKGWQVGLYEYPRFTLPAGSSLAAYAYCKKNAAPKPKK